MINNFMIAYEDQSILVIDKPQGLAAAPGKMESLCDLLYRDFPELARIKGYDRGEGALLNRLDNDTGGLVLFARSKDAFSYYHEQMQAGQLEKKYAAVIYGSLSGPEGVIDDSIGHAPDRSNRMVISRKPGDCRGTPRPARTEWKVLAVKDGCSVVELTLIKGMRHQLRVHLAAAGCPIVGDRIYSDKKPTPGVPHLLLYAYQLTFVSMTEGPQTVAVPVPFLAKGAWGYTGPLGG